MVVGIGIEAEEVVVEEAEVGGEGEEEDEAAVGVDDGEMAQLMCLAWCNWTVLEKWG